MFPPRLRQLFHPTRSSCPPSIPSEIPSRLSDQSNRLGRLLCCTSVIPLPAEHPPGTTLGELAAPHTAESASTSWLLFDIETVPDSDGGSFAFLIGVAQWGAGGLLCKQFFAPRFSEEPAVLLAAAESIHAQATLVSYNGLRFDWPILETRCRTTARIALARPAAHLDLLPPSRALWRPRIGSARLRDIERYVLGWDRGPDIESALVGTVYRRYLLAGSEEALTALLEHNRNDLYGLALLAIRFDQLLHTPELADPDEILTLASWLEKRHNEGLALRLLQAAQRCGLAQARQAESAQRIRRLSQRMAGRRRSSSEATGSDRH